MSTEIPLPSPWKEFLAEIDAALNEPLELHCIGGFVVVYFYDFSRTTGDVDYYAAIPADFNLVEEAGEGSRLHQKYGLCLHKVAVTTLPEDYESRLTEMAKGQFRHLKLLVPDPYDCILSKLDRNGDVDVNDAEYLIPIAKTRSAGAPRAIRERISILYHRRRTEDRYNVEVVDRHLHILVTNHDARGVGYAENHRGRFKKGNSHEVMK